MVSCVELEKFWEYVVFYPGMDEAGYDGVHSGGVKGIREDAPETAKKAFAEYQEMCARAKAQGLKI